MEIWWVACLVNKFLRKIRDRCVSLDVLLYVAISCEMWDKFYFFRSIKIVHRIDKESIYLNRISIKFPFSKFMKIDRKKRLHVDRIDIFFLFKLLYFVIKDATALLDRYRFHSKWRQEMPFLTLFLPPFLVKRKWRNSGQLRGTFSFCWEKMEKEK